MIRRIAISLALATAFLAAAASCQPASDPVDYEATVVPKSSVADSDDGFTYVTVTAKGEWSIELQYPSEGPRDWAVMDPASGNGNKTDARIRYSQNEEDDARTVTLLLFSEGKQVNSAIFTQNAPIDHDATLIPRSNVADSDDGFTYVTVTAKGEWTIELQYPSEGPRDWAVMDPASGNGYKGDARIRYSQNEEDDARTVTLLLFSEGRQVHSATFTQFGQAPQTSTSDGYDTTTAGWLELPETKAGDGCVFLPHDMEGKKYLNKAQSGVRNWSCYWCYDEHVSYWVAYPHNNALIGRGERSNAWGVFDPLLPSFLQPNMANTYGGGWTRGHQIPSADRYNDKANRSTFYPTNMTPQEYNFNAGIWARLEGQIRSYAGSSDTTYVVTGCVLEGSNRWSGNNSGFTVKVPSAYFKAVLQKSTSTAVGHNGWRAAAWYLPHDTSIAGGSYYDYVLSVDALEKKLGYDLFVNLPSAVGAKKADEIEADCAWAK